MSTTNLFSDFEAVSTKQWKQQIQFELKGADYNETLVWESPEGIKVKPFYHRDEMEPNCNLSAASQGFQITQSIYVHDVAKSNARAFDSLNRGADSILFTLENDQIDISSLMAGLPLEATTYFFNLPFLSSEFVNQLNQFAVLNKANFKVLIDPIGQLGKDGNWFENLDNDFKRLNSISQTVTIPYLSITSSLYQNAGATIVQQLAYTIAHANEYFNRINSHQHPVTVEVAVGSNYFFEIAKLRALRLLLHTLAAEYHYTSEITIIAKPSRRNKTVYDYNVNMLRTTTECMSAVLGGADFVSNLPYDALYHKDNEFGDRIARNQLLILKHESYLDTVHNPADGTYYIEALTHQMAEKALVLFKDIEANGGLIAQLMEGTLQRKINESAQKEQDAFDNGKEILLGTNKFPNKNDRMKGDLELYPFVKYHPRKTLIIPIIEKRLAEKLEQERLATEELS